MVDQEQFTLDKLRETAAKLAQQGQEIDCILYTELLDEIVKLLQMFGTAVSFAFAGKFLKFWDNFCVVDVKEKSTIIKQNKALHEGTGTWKDLSLLQMMLWEKSEGYADCKALKKKAEKGTW